MLGEILLLVAACICIIVLSVRLTEHSSSAVQIGTMLAVALGLTLVMIFSITAIQTPKAAQLQTALPAGIPLVNLYRRKLVAWLWAAAAYFAIFGTLCFFAGTVRDIAQVILAMGAYLACIMLPTGFFMMRKMDRAATAVTLHPWVHWHYSDASWKSWTRTRVERLKAHPASFELKRDWRRVAWVCLGIVAGALIVSPGGWGERAAWALGCCAWVFAWVEFTVWESQRAPEKLRRRLERASPDTYFGPDGLICDDALCSWLSADVYLKSAAVDADEPRSLNFSFEKFVPNPYGPAQTVTIVQSVLIPPGCDPSDVSRLQSALATLCPTAKIAIA